MERWIVEAVAANNVVRGGSHDPVAIVASVAQLDGSAVQGLTRDNFHVGFEVPGLGTHRSNQLSVFDGLLPGIYRVDVRPFPGESWNRGVFIFSVTITSNAARGQTLCSCVIGV